MRAAVKTRTLRLTTLLPEISAESKIKKFKVFPFGT